MKAVRNTISTITLQALVAHTPHMKTWAQLDEYMKGFKPVSFDKYESWEALGKDAIRPGILVAQKIRVSGFNKMANPDGDHYKVLRVMSVETNLKFNGGGFVELQTVYATNKPSSGNRGSKAVMRPLVALSNIYKCKVYPGLELEPVEQKPLDAPMSASANPKQFPEVSCQGEVTSQTSDHDDIQRQILRALLVVANNTHPFGNGEVTLPGVQALGRLDNLARETAKTANTLERTNGYLERLVAEAATTNILLERLVRAWEGAK